MDPIIYNLLSEPLPDAFLRFFLLLFDETTSNPQFAQFHPSCMMPATALVLFFNNVTLRIYFKRTILILKKSYRYYFSRQKSNAMADELFVHDAAPRVFLKLCASFEYN